MTAVEARGALIAPLTVGRAWFMLAFGGNAVIVALLVIGRGFGEPMLASGILITGYLVGAAGAVNLTRTALHMMQSRL